MRKMNRSFHPQGVITPCIYVFITKWIPVQEQGLLLNLIVSGASLGTVLTMPISAMLCDSPLGWPGAFYVFGKACGTGDFPISGTPRVSVVFLKTLPRFFVAGAGGLVSTLVWFIYAADGPEHHSWISPIERDYIVNSRPASSKRSPKFVSTSKITQVLRVISSQRCQDKILPGTLGKDAPVSCSHPLYNRKFRQNSEFLHAPDGAAELPQEHFWNQHCEGESGS